ncbi:glycine cleavage system H protein [Constrictibacter sp. MBR-5]|jgi:glycine cleavage system H protein|uniref:glycine cleavage system protein GcvH n=1 Tax=Constrictibacter sp. MBR-5 TaxID=3156467 RepID=UPI0033960ACF
MADIYYTEDHEWISVEDGVGTVGITDYAQSQLGDVVYVELPDVGKELAQKDEAAVVESVKAASDVYAPVSGEVVEVNEALADTPGTVNESASSDGWFYKIKLSEPSELEDLMDEAAYQAFIEGLG